MRRSRRRRAATGCEDWQDEQKQECEGPTETGHSGSLHEAPSLVESLVARVSRRFTDLVFHPPEEVASASSLKVFQVRRLEPLEWLAVSGRYASCS